MPSLSHIDILRVFLIYHKAHSAYLCNHNNTASYYYDCPGALVNDMIALCGFDWRESPEGEFYWSDLNRKWYKLCADFNLEDVEIFYE